MRNTALAAFLALLLTACGGSHQQRLLQLEELERQNRADSVMLNDSLARGLCDYFDDHGTANERLRAHYILGRTYADRGEAPAAIAAYMDAADCADTTAADCDYHTLSRVYGQMSSVYYAQNLMEDYITCIDRSIGCAWKANDTTQALREQMLKVVAYDQQQNADSVIVIFERVFRQYVYFCRQTEAAPFCTLPIMSLLAKGETEKARNYLRIYESESGYFDSLSNIARGREIYYYFKGSYYLHVCQYDSAEYYFRRELLYGLDFNNQNAASLGLSQLYTQTGQSDSAAKYALYSYAMNDSLYNTEATEAVARMQAVYNYNRQLRRAEIEQRKAERQRQANYRLCGIIIVLLVGIATGFYAWRKYRLKAENRLRNSMQELSRLQELKESQERLIKEKELNIRGKELTVKRMEQDIERLRLHAQEYESLIAEKEMFIEQAKAELYSLQDEKNTLAIKLINMESIMSQLQDTINAYSHRDVTDMDAVPVVMADSPIFRQLLSRTLTCRELTDEEWAETETMIKQMLPGFYGFAASVLCTFGEEEYKTCILLRLNIGMKAAAGLVGISKSKVSKLSKRILKEKFGCEGSSKELQKLLLSIS